MTGAQQIQCKVLQLDQCEAPHCMQALMPVHSVQKCHASNQ